MNLPEPSALEVSKLGPCEIPSPLARHHELFVDDNHRVVASPDVGDLKPYFESYGSVPGFEIAGPRSKVYFESEGLTAGIVTCGGLCPGLNDVIRSITLTLNFSYGIDNVLGFRFGYSGLVPEGDAPMRLTREVVSQIHTQGGTLLGSSRGAEDIGTMVDQLVRHNVKILFTIGGDGTLRGTSVIAEEIARRGLKIAMVGIPKTIDNDLHWIERSFGFETAVDEARRAVLAAHAEARGAHDGVGIVKLMGRHSGFIAAHACLANSDVNCCMIPEVPCRMHGENGFLAALERRLRQRRHAVVVVAEGAGQDILATDAPQKFDASGNTRLNDIGTYIRDCIGAYSDERGLGCQVKYIDPSYMLRSIPANASDAELCLMLGQSAVHAGMAGRTNMLVGYLNQRFIHVPIPLATGRRKQVDPHGTLWRAVLSATGQPSKMY